MIGKKTAPQEAPKPNNRDCQPTPFEIERARELLVKSLRQKCERNFEERKFAFSKCVEGEKRFSFEYIYGDLRSKFVLHCPKTHDGKASLTLLNELHQFEVLTSDAPENNFPTLSVVPPPDEC